MFKNHDIVTGVRTAHVASRLRAPAFGVIRRIQDVHPSDQILATAVALAAMCEATGLDMHDLVSQAKRAVPDVSSFSPHISAIRDYAATELAHRKPKKNGMLLKNGG